MKRSLILALFLLSLSAFAQEQYGGYTVDRWHAAKVDETIFFRLTKDAKENCPKFQMKTVLDATPDEIILPILEYANYANTMPRMYESNVRHTTENETLSIPMSKQLGKIQNIPNAAISIVQFKVDIPNWWDRAYTLLLASHKDIETQEIFVYWTQFDEANFKSMTGPWKTIAPDPYRTNFWGNRVFNTGTYPNDNEDLYGHWHLTPLSDTQTDVFYETYIDPGSLGRSQMDSIVENTLEDLPKIILTIREGL